MSPLSATDSVEIERIEASTLAGVPGIAHGFLSRGHGAGPGLYDGLNCGPGSRDDPARVRANRAAAAAAFGLGPGALVTAYQVHSAACVTVEAPWTPDAAPRADALVTDRPDVLIGVLTADCAPVLMADPEAGVVGAAHAGWRGALGGILEATLAAMTARGARPERIRAAIGPCIGKASYEVGPELQDQFVLDDPDNARWFDATGDGDRLLFDLEGYARARLARGGVPDPEGLGLDTLTTPDRFFSYRRNSLAGETDYGRLLSAIRLTG